MMSDKDLERRLAELRDNWRVAGEPPLDRMWERVEAEAFAPAHRRFGTRWIRPWLPLAAMLVLGFGVGQLSPRLVGKGVSRPQPGPSSRPRTGFRDEMFPLRKSPSSASRPTTSNASRRCW